MTRKTVCICAAPDILDLVVQAALSQLVPVNFVHGARLDEVEHADAFIGRMADDTLTAALLQRKQPCFFVAERTDTGASPGDGKPVRFGGSPVLDKRIRGRSLFNKAVSCAGPIKLEPGDTTLASYGETPVWVLRERLGVAAHIVSAPLPKLKTGEKPLDYLHGDQFIQLLPLLHFLRQVTADVDWTKPGLRACLMIDDPNLHWTSYGFLPYGEVLALAKKCNFHLAFATVPLDGWRADNRAVELIKLNAGQISLLVHGNDHCLQELGQARSPEEHLRLFAQSLQRIARLEQRTGLRVARVMAPPHGAFAEAGCPAMQSVGYEGACVSPWSLQDWNPDRDWPPAFGLGMAEILAEGFPAIPRFRLSSTCEGPIVISAFLDRPIIPVFHHDALADGLDLLSQAAATINSLGEVRWGSPQMILRSNYLARQQNDTLWIKPFASRLRVNVPPGVKSLVLDADDSIPEEKSAVAQEWKVDSQPATVRSGNPIPVEPEKTLEITSIKLGAVDCRAVKVPRVLPWAVSRRILCESRDRLAPLKQRLSFKTRRLTA